MGSGGGSGATYWLYQDVGGANDSLLGSATGNSNGDVRIFTLVALNQTVTVWLHDTNNSAIGHRIGSSLAISFGSGGTTPVYVTTVPVLSTTPGNTTATLT